MRLLVLLGRPTTCTMLNRLFDIAPEAFRRIAFLTVFDSSFPNPPRDFLNLSILCRASNRILSSNSAPIYVAIFSANFDFKGPLCALGPLVVERNIKDEVQRRFSLLKVIRRREFDHPRLTEAFWIAYMMYEDADRTQKNWKGLIAAGLYGFLNTFLRTRLYEGSGGNSGWPIPNELNSLAVALYWLSSSQQLIHRESEQQRREMEQLLKPFVFAAFRYPIFGTPESHFDPAMLTKYSPSPTVHGPYPPPTLLPHEVIYFGKVKRMMRVPPVSLYATLCFFARQETRTPMIPPHLLPENRGERAGVPTGPTLRDIQAFSEHCVTRFAGLRGVDFGLLVQAITPHISVETMPLPERPSYTLGTLTRHWQGSYIHPYLDDYTNWLNTLRLSPEFSTTGRHPLYMSLQEHFTCDHASMVPTVDPTSGTKNSWLPNGLGWIQRKGGVEFFNEQGTFRTVYETFRHGGRILDDKTGVIDVIITGETAPQHAAAWGGHRIFGRIRLSDGLVVLSREALNGEGSVIMRGYVTSEQNFVGRFKGLSNGRHPSLWESSFSLCEVRENRAIQ